LVNEETVQDALVKNEKVEVAMTLSTEAKESISLWGIWRLLEIHIGRLMHHFKSLVRPGL